MPEPEESVSASFRDGHLVGAGGGGQDILHIQPVCAGEIGGGLEHEAIGEVGRPLHNVIGIALEREARTIRREQESHARRSIWKES